MSKVTRIVGAMVALAALGCGGGGGEPAATMRIASPAFAHGANMAVTYTCDAENASPPISWDQVPENAQSLVLLVEDRDADGYAHWVLYDMPPTVRGVTEGGMPEAGKVGTNAFQRPGYGGPCPPAGQSHRYTFNLYALDAMLNLPDGATAAQVREAMQGHVLARGELIGLYAR